MSGFFDFTGDSPWGGSLEDEDAPGGGGGGGKSGGNLRIDPSIDLDCIFDDDDALGDEQEAVFGEDGAISSTIDDQWSKLTSMYLDLTVDDDDEAPKPAKQQGAGAAPARTVIPALPTATFFSPTKAGGAASSQAEELWNSPSPVVVSLPPGFEAKPKAMSVDQLEQQLQASAGAASPSGGGPALPSTVMTLDDLEGKLLAPPSDKAGGQAISLEELEARLIQAQPPTAQFVPVPGCDSRTIVEEDDQEGVDLPSQFAQLPYYSRVEVDREFMSAADMNYILKVQRVPLANLPNLYADDFYFQNYTRHRESQQTDGGSGSGETVLLVDHFPLCQLALPPVPPKAPVDFTGVLGKIPPSSLRGPREVLQLAADEQAALAQASKPGQLPSQPILPRNLGAFAKYSTLMVLENALSLVIEVEDLDILLAKPNLSADKTRKLALKRATRTQRIFQMLRVYTPQTQQQPPPAPNGSGYCFREDALFFQLLGRAKGRELAGRALTVLPLREVFALIMVLVRNWDHALRLLSQPDAASRLMVARLLAKIQALTVPSLASVLHVFLAAYYSRFAFVAAQPLSARLLTALVQRAADIHRKEAEPDMDPSQRSHPLHWHAFSRVFSQLCLCLSVSVNQLVGDPRAGPPEKWDLLEAVLSSAHPSQKHEILGLISTSVGGELLSNPPAGLARLFRV